MAAAGAVGEEVGAVEVRAAAEIVRRGGADAAEQDQAAAAARRGQHGLEVACPNVGEGQADGNATDVFGETADRDGHRQGRAGRRWRAGDAVGHQSRAGTRERIGEGVKGRVQVHRQGALETAAGVAKHQGCLMLPAGQVGGGGFQSDGDHGRGSRGESAGGRTHRKPGGLGCRRPVEWSGAAVGQGVAATAGGEGTALGAGGDQAGTGDAQGVWRDRRMERGFGHDNADSGIAIRAGRLDVERAGVQQGADFGGAQVRVVGLQQAGDCRRVRRRGRGAKEGGETGHRGGDAVGGGEIGFGEPQAAAGGEVARGEGRAIGLVKHPARAVAAERLDDIPARESCGGRGGG